ncbi:hypothetical protein DIPPA_22752 [Diplonema papillatum]|nr:hypothetical protein DIPPA_25536 [Diplonema papillatum]KAJ9456558.1 hypothetical protein DIPPA_22752 [Diplonema papillatum]
MRPRRRCGESTEPIRPAFDEILNRRSPDEKWPRRAALFSVLFLVAAAVYTLFFRHAALPETVDLPSGGVQSVWKHRINNTADLDSGGKPYGLPRLGHGFESENRAKVPARPTDELSDALWTARGARYAADLADFICGELPVEQPAEAGKATGNEQTRQSCRVWLDAGLLVHYATKAKSRPRSTTLLAVGMRDEYRERYHSALAEAASDPSFPVRDGCRVAFKNDSGSTAEWDAAPDARWAIVCNEDIVIRVLVYRPHNATHYALPWPSTHRRCFRCPSDSFFLPINLTRPLVPCTPTSKDVAAIVRSSSAMSYCVNSSTAYLTAWTGRDDWVEYHMGHRFSHTRLTSSVHGGLWLILKWVLIIAVTLGAMFLCLVGAGWLNLI